MDFRGCNIRLLKSPPIEDVRAVLTQIRAHGGNSVAFVTTHKCYLQGASVAYPPLGWTPNWLIFPDVGQDPAHPFGDTVSTERLYAFCLEARKQGFERILLKPHIDSDYGAWRGWIQVPRTMRARFLADYKARLLSPLFPILKDTTLRDCVDLCIGTELVQITKDYGADFWLNIVRWLRYKGVRNRLTYAANWGWAEDAEYNRLRDLWPALDYIGIDAYWPMCNDEYRGPLSKGQLLGWTDENIGWGRKLAVNGVPQEWCPDIYADLTRLQREVGKPLVFTEIGYPATDYAAHEPARDPQGTWTPTYELSKSLWEVAFEVWGDVLEGWYAWEAGLLQTAGSTHDILNTPYVDTVLQP